MARDIEKKRKKEPHHIVTHKHMPSARKALAGMSKDDKEDKSEQPNREESKLSTKLSSLLGC